MPLPKGPGWPTPVQTVSFLRHPYEFFARARRAFGPVFTVRLAFFPTPIVTVSQREHVEQVFTAPSDVLSGAEGNAALRPIFGDHSIGMLEGPPHARRRKLVGPPFYANRAGVYTRTMREIVDEAFGRAAENRDAFPLLPVMRDVAREVLLRTTFGLSGERLDAGRTILARLMKTLDNPAVLLVPAFQRSFFGLSPWARFQREIAELHAWILGEVAHARDDRSERKDVLAALVRAVDDDGRALLDEELRDEIVTLLVAGHDTTATSLAWLFERVLVTPGVAARLRDEIDDVVAGGALEDADLDRLELVDAAVKEALRMRPVVPGAFRKIVAPFSIDGQVIEPGPMIMTNAHLAHHDDVRYPEPDRFDLERFRRDKPDLYAWIPFGGGLRRCIGLAYALHEMKVVLAAALSRWELELVGGPEPVHVRGPHQSPRHGVPVRLRTRGPLRNHA
jgi:cytochrome P450 family 110